MNQGVTRKRNPFFLPAFHVPLRRNAARIADLPPLRKAASATNLPARRGVVGAAVAQLDLRPHCYGMNWPPLTSMICPVT